MSECKCMKTRSYLCNVCGGTAEETEAYAKGFDYAEACHKKDMDEAKDYQTGKSLWRKRAEVAEAKYEQVVKINNENSLFHAKRYEDLKAELEDTTMFKDAWGEQLDEVGARCKRYEVALSTIMDLHVCDITSYSEKENCDRDHEIFNLAKDALEGK